MTVFTFRKAAQTSEGGLSSPPGCVCLDSDAAGRHAPSARFESSSVFAKMDGSDHGRSEPQSTGELENFGLTAEKAQYRESEIRRHFLEAWVEGYEGLIPVMTNQEKDRNVLAAVARARSGVIVTYKTKDFSRASLAPYSISAQGPSTFLKNLYELDPVRVMQTPVRQAESIDQTLPPFCSPSYV
jgi:hypothetical protein